VTGRILISGLRVATRVGWTDEERAEPRFVLVDLDVEIDVGTAAASDDLADTVDYATVVSEVARHVAARESRLLERLAAEVAELVSAMKGVKRVSVEIGKEVVPVPEEVGRVAVHVERSA
jgi:dihydroneopterin aldolase